MSELKIPYSHEAECYVLSAMLIEEELAREFSSSLTSIDFYNKRNKEVFNAIKALNDENATITVITVIEKLKLHGQYGFVNEKYLFELTEMLPTVVTTESFVKVLKEKSVERELYFQAKELVNTILEGKSNLSDLLAISEKKLKDIADKQQAGSMTTLSHLVDGVFDIIENNRNKEGSLIGLDTGYNELNEYTLGFQNGELIILAARPGVGKSALALNIGRKMCLKHGKHVACFALEMSTEQVIMRMLSMSSNVPLKKIRSGNLDNSETTKLLAGRVALDNLNFYLDVTATTSLEDIKIQCRKLKRENRLDFIIIDYLQLLNVTTDGKKLSRYEEVTHLSRALKLLAMELHVPILALSQMSRAVDQRGKKDRRPLLSDLRESGSIEQDADLVLFLHNENEEDEIGLPTKEIKLIIAKNRQGSVGDVDLLYRGEYTLFENKIGK